MEKIKMNILNKYADSESFYNDIKKVKKLSDKDIKRIINLHLDNENDRRVIRPILEKLYPDEKYSLVTNASLFFAILIQEGLEKKCKVEDFTAELKLLNFKNSTIKIVNSIFQEKLKAYIQLEVLEEPKIVNNFCKFRWRIDKTLHDIKLNNRNSIKIVMTIFVHKFSGDHKEILFEMSPSEFENFYDEISNIRKVLNSASN